MWASMLSRLMVSMTAMATAQASGPAAEGGAVHAGSDGAAAASVQSIAPMGMPLAMGLARVVTSGRMP